MTKKKPKTKTKTKTKAKKKRIPLASPPTQRGKGPKLDKLKKIAKYTGYTLAALDALSLAYLYANRNTPGYYNVMSGPG